MIEQRSTDFENNYLFTGHELDRETNLYYAHARYLNPRLGVWMSVDPLAEEFSSYSPYNYCLRNPVNLVDPSGMSSEGPGDVLL
jgi:RHS repeat-associated protein